MHVGIVKVRSFPRFDATMNIPTVTDRDYKVRMERLIDLMNAGDFSHTVVYGDREHFANVFYLTGYDPRFEEALLIVRRDEIPTLVVGDEGMSYASIAPGELRKVLYRSFAVMGLPRQQSSCLAKILRATGLTAGSKVGLVGWKYFSREETQNPRRQIDIPHYLVQAIVDLVGDADRVENATDLMLHPQYGLRTRLDWKELILHEVAGTKASQKVLHFLEHLEPGMTEIEASMHLEIDGDPLSAHPVVSFGARNVLLGLASPSYTQKLSKGDPVSVSLCYRRANIARTGLFARTREEIPVHMAKVVDDLLVPYYRALVAWYETLGIGVSGGTVYREVQVALGDSGKYGVTLNPGHLTHTDEWTTSIFYQDCPHKIASGMAIQADIIAFPGGPYVGTHVEDGILIADRNVRGRLRGQFPKHWERICARRRFMKETLGIRLAPEVLPTSNIQAVLFPYMGDTRTVLSVGG